MRRIRFRHRNSGIEAVIEFQSHRFKQRYGAPRMLLLRSTHPSVYSSAYYPQILVTADQFTAEWQEAP